MNFSKSLQKTLNLDLTHSCDIGLGLFLSWWSHSWRCRKLSPFPVSHIWKEKIYTIKANFELILIFWFHFETNFKVLLRYKKSYKFPSSQMLDKIINIIQFLNDSNLVLFSFQFNFDSNLVQCQFWMIPKYNLITKFL